MKKFIKTFFGTIKRSFTDPSIYKNSIDSTEPFSLKYPATLALLGSIITSITLCFFIYSYGLPALRNEINVSFPENLELQMTANELSINQPSPYKIQTPASLKSEIERGNVKSRDAEIDGLNKDSQKHIVQEIYENLVVIDTDAKPELSVLESYSSYGLLTKKALVLRSENEVRTMFFKDIPDFSLNKQKIITFFDSVKTYAWILPVIAIVPIWLVSFIGLLFGALISALLLYLALKVFRRSMSVSFKQSYAVSMIGYSVVYIVTEGMLLFGIVNIDFSFKVVAGAILTYVILRTSK